jgi:hypothetical protein
MCFSATASFVAMGGGMWNHAAFPMECHQVCKASCRFSCTRVSTTWARVWWALQRGSEVAGIVTLDKGKALGVMQIL